jgi:hypothetical protein
MAVTVTFDVTPKPPAHGDTVTAVYTVQGNDPTPGKSATVNGSADVGGQVFAVSTTITAPGVPALPVTYAVPTCPGLTFKATADPWVFTAVVP